jgi:DNA-binding NtrC family response regulator
MSEYDYLEGKRILVVDDEPDVLESLMDLLSMCEVTKASNFNDAKEFLESRYFDMAVLDIMGVEGYDLLEVANQKDVTAVMLTAHALSPENMVKSYKEGAASYLPKEEMINIASFLNEILEAKEKGKNTWLRWYDRMGSFFEKRFGKDWKKSDQEFWEKFPFY